MSHDLPLGREVDYPDTYTPDVLVPVARQLARDQAGIREPLLFSGEDIWNAWELTWLDRDGKPQAGAIELRVPSTSTSICESKSLKLYLNSFAMSAFASRDDVRSTIAVDLERIVGAAVSVRFMDAGSGEGVAVGAWPSTCIDGESITKIQEQPSDVVLQSDSTQSVSEDLYTDLFRSLCPVTGQPDYASIRIRYGGPRIDRVSLLEYLVAFRRHQDFHEACVERIFTKLMDECGCQRLLVNARFLRRGGIDINPWRANYDAVIPNGRLWRQ